MKYVLGVFGVLVLMILAVILITRRGPDEPIPVQTGDKQVVLAEYADKPATAVFKTEGELRAEEERRAIRITVSHTERVIEVLKGYEETVERRETYPNNEAAYETFILALDKAGFSRETDTEIKDDRGVCPLGRRYEYKLRADGEDVFRLWGSSCGRKSGNFGGSSTTVRLLFQHQIPDYSRVTRGVKL